DGAGEARDRGRGERLVRRGAEIPRQPEGAERRQREERDDEEVVGDVEGREEEEQRRRRVVAVLRRLERHAGRVRTRERRQPALAQALELRPEARLEHSEVIAEEEAAGRVERLAEREGDDEREREREQPPPGALVHVRDR